MRGKRISDDKIKRFIQLKSERNKSTNQIIRDLRDKGYGVRKQRFLNIYREVKRENKNVYYIRSYRYKSIEKRNVKKKQLSKVSKKRKLKKVRKRIKLITVDKEFTSWVKKGNIELDVRYKKGLYNEDYMAYFGSSQTVTECSGGNCFTIIRNKYLKKGIMSHFDFLRLMDRAKELSYDAPIIIKIYNKRTKALEYHSIIIDGNETNYLNLNRGVFYE